MSDNLQFLPVPPPTEAREGEGKVEAARKLALRITEGAGPDVLWCGGFRSDMASTKAEAIAGWARQHGRRFVRFDYSGHGLSEGRFEEGTISRWRQDAEAVLRQCTRAPTIIVGSSMGGWIALLMARALATTGEKHIAGLLLIAPAMDFTEALMWAQFSDEVKREIMEQGVWQRPSPYGPEPYPITRALIEDGRRNLVLGEPFHVGCPVHILQGKLDADVPWQHAMQLVEHLPSDPVTLTMVQDGDHRLSREQDIALLLRSLAAMAEEVSG
jgi:pimeloyl-ACP methyl ester carboxylesterase